MKAKNVIRSVMVAELVLLVPLIAKAFTSEVDWGARDFVIASVLLAGMGVAYQMIASGLKNNSHLVIIGIILVGAILLIWAELAVGIFGSPFAGS